jgi:hypothetical protein
MSVFCEYTTRTRHVECFCLPQSDEKTRNSSPVVRPQVEKTAEKELVHSIRHNGITLIYPDFLMAINFVKRLRFLSGTEENYEKSPRIASVPGEIRTGHLLNMSQEGYRYANPFGGCGNHNILTAYYYFQRSTNVASSLSNAFKLTEVTHFLTH